MNERPPFLCSLRQGTHGVDIFSATNELLPLLESKDLIPFIPGYSCRRKPAYTGYKVCYFEQEELTIACSADNKSIEVSGRFDLFRDGEVIPYLACSLLEIQRQIIGQTSVHAAAVSLNGQGVLLMGKEGSGKTSLALYLCRAYGYKLIANDIAIIGYDQGQVFIYDGTKFFWLRLSPIQTHHPDLVRLFSASSKRDPWTNRAVVYPEQIGVEVETGFVPITAIFFLHIDESATETYSERSIGRWPRLYLYENFSRYIRRTCSPMMGGKEFKYLAYLPSLDSPNLHTKRVVLIDYLIDELGIQYISGRLKEIGGIINQVVNTK